MNCSTPVDLEYNSLSRNDLRLIPTLATAAMLSVIVDSTFRAGVVIELRIH